MSDSPDVFVVFYCWQSDTPSNHGRYLIREALDQAADRLSRDTALPFKVEIDSDTCNETGMCDIPATILKKLQNADAVVADLTFVAKTSDDKHCSNPNVLFELGYAFRTIGPERLICVMNEKHGPKTSQIFDLAHRRHPVPFTSPGESQTRKEAIDKLSIALETVLRPIIKLGPSGGMGGDDQRRHEAERSRIEAFWESQSARGAGTPIVTMFFRPLRYRGRRWSDAQQLESLLRKRLIWNGRHEFPPQQVGTAAMEWGIYNGTYGEPYGAMTYAGQAWLGAAIEGWKTLNVSERDLRLSPDPPENQVLEASSWVPLARLASYFGNAFRFLASLTEEFGDGERLEWSVTGQSLNGKWLNLSADWGDVIGPSMAPGYSRSGHATAAEFKANWLEYSVDCAKEACDLFSRDGRYVTKDVLAKLMSKSGEAAVQ